MEKFVYRVGDPNGFHARPTGQLVNFVKKLDSEVTIRKGEREANGKKLLAVMSLGAKYRDELTFTLSGQNAGEERQSLLGFLDENLPPYGKN